MNSAYLEFKVKSFKKDLYSMMDKTEAQLKKDQIEAEHALKAQNAMDIPTYIRELKQKYDLNRVFKVHLVDDCRFHNKLHKRMKLLKDKHDKDTILKCYVYEPVKFINDENATQTVNNYISDYSLNKYLYLKLYLSKEKTKYNDNFLDAIKQRRLSHQKYKQIVKYSKYTDYLVKLIERLFKLKNCYKYLYKLKHHAIKTNLKIKYRHKKLMPLFLQTVKKYNRRTSYANILQVTKSIINKRLSAHCHSLVKFYESKLYYSKLWRSFRIYHRHDFNKNIDNVYHWFSTWKWNACKALLSIKNLTVHNAKKEYLFNLINAFEKKNHYRKAYMFREFKLKKTMNAGLRQARYFSGIHMLKKRTNFKLWHNLYKRNRIQSAAVYNFELKKLCWARMQFEYRDHKLDSTNQTYIKFRKFISKVQQDLKHKKLKFRSNLEINCRQREFKNIDFKEKEKEKEKEEK